MFFRTNVPVHKVTFPYTSTTSASHHYPHTSYNSSYYFAPYSQPTCGALCALCVLSPSLYTNNYLSLNAGSFSSVFIPAAKIIKVKYVFWFLDPYSCWNICRRQGQNHFFICILRFLEHLHHKFSKPL